MNSINGSLAQWGKFTAHDHQQDIYASDEMKPNTEVNLRKVMVDFNQKRPFQN